MSAEADPVVEPETPPPVTAVVVKPVPNTTIMDAKTNAIASLTSAAYAKASELRLTKEESDALLADFDDDAFRTGAAGKDNLIYIEHANLRDRLNEVFGLGQWALVPQRHWESPYQFTKNTGEIVHVVKVYCEAVLIVRGCFVGSAIGDMDYYPHNQATNYGDAFEGAKTAAFRRCAKEFGIGLQAWRKSWCEGWFLRRGKTPPKQTHADPLSGPQNAPQGQQPAFKNKVCPDCGKEALGRSQYPPKGKPNDPPGWYCYGKSGGCGHSFAFTDPKVQEKIVDDSPFGKIMQALHDCKVLEELEPIRDSANAQKKLFNPAQSEAIRQLITELKERLPADGRDVF